MNFCTKKNWAKTTILKQVVQKMQDNKHAVSTNGGSNASETARRMRSLIKLTVIIHLSIVSVFLCKLVVAANKHKSFQLLPTTRIVLMNKATHATLACACRCTRVNRNMLILCFKSKSKPILVIAKLTKNTKLYLKRMQYNQSTIVKSLPSTL